MKIPASIIGILCTLILCTGCAYAAEEDTATVTPVFALVEEAIANSSETLLPGDTVHATMTIRYSKGDMNFGSALKLDSDLADPSWTVDIWRGGVVITTLHPTEESSYRIGGFDLSGYGVDIDLVIAVEGTVTNASAGRSISPIRLIETVTQAAGDTTYDSPTRYVVNPWATPTPTPESLPTPTPVPITPSPLLGLIAGLGVAVFGYRMKH